jgi:hypothetical protein
VGALSAARQGSDPGCCAGCLGRVDAPCVAVVIWASKESAQPSGGHFQGREGKAKRRSVCARALCLALLVCLKGHWNKRQGTINRQGAVGVSLARCWAYISGPKGIAQRMRCHKHRIDSLLVQGVGRRADENNR